MQVQILHLHAHILQLLAFPWPASQSSLVRILTDFLSMFLLHGFEHTFSNRDSNWPWLEDRQMHYLADLQVIFPQQCFRWSLKKLFISTRRRTPTLTSANIFSFSSVLDQWRRLHVTAGVITLTTSARSVRFIARRKNYLVSVTVVFMSLRDIVIWIIVFSDPSSGSLLTAEWMGDR